MMTDSIQNLFPLIVLSPLVGSVLAGLGGKYIGRSGSHWVTIIGVAISLVLSLLVFQHVIIDKAGVYDISLYTWMETGGIKFEIGFMVDALTSVMLVVVTSVSLLVHIYTIGYMQDDPGYSRFFSYISLFTFSMLVLVMSNNFLQLFFGWEAVGLVSYLLIGFWYHKETAIYANMKAFLVNRVGDFGFLLGIGAVLMYFNSLDYQTVFNQAPGLADKQIEIIPGVSWSLMSVTCILLFIGAMGKSAQVPLHVWLPDSMEGPTPISALIHAATMVTAGIFMVSRMSPLFEYSETALSFVLVVGSITAFFMGLLGLVQNDIKRVVAYSTLSQLGYMTVALGVSAYGAAIFHLMTHAFFKALLFLGAGSVIIAMHHEQDMRKMGGLWRYLPITYITGVIGTLALTGFPPFAGFFSKDAIIEAVQLSTLPGAGIAYVSVLAGVFITALYSFRLLFMTFHGEERMDEHTKSHLHETPAVVTIPLVLLAVPSVLVGYYFIEQMLFNDFWGKAIFVLSQHDVLSALGKEFHGTGGMISHAIFHPSPLWLAIAGAGTAWFLYILRPDVPALIQKKFSSIHSLLERKYGFDEFNEKVFAGGSLRLGNNLWKTGDEKIIDGQIINGSARFVNRMATRLSDLQTGYLYRYAFVMVFGLLIMLGYQLVIS
jgi:NADH-quinone oxidoreductase subunit L